MTLEEIIAFLDRTLSEGWKKTFLRSKNKTERIFSQTLKISEEVGELSSEILWTLWFVRQEKLHKYTQESLMDEFADVVLATLRLARFMDIDIALALKNKMEKIKNR